MPIERNRRPTHPGTFLVEFALKPNKVSITKLAHSIGMSRTNLSHILNGRQRLEPKVAAKIAVCFDISIGPLIQMQAAVDTWDAKQEIKTWQPKDKLELAGTTSGR